MLSRVMVVVLLAIAGMMVPSVATATESASIWLPDKVKAGQRVEAAIRCADGDTRAEVSVKRGFLSASRDVKLSDGQARSRVTIPDGMPAGKYKVALTCRPSGATSSENVTVTK